MHIYRYIVINTRFKELNGLVYEGRHTSKKFVSQINALTKFANMYN